MRRYEKDGEVAVIYSPGYGAGWSSWADKSIRYLLCCHHDIAVAVERNQYKDFETFKKVVEAALEENDLLGKYYIDNPRKLDVEWVPLGWLFKIEEYDGYEKVISKPLDGDWIALI